MISSRKSVSTNTVLALALLVAVFILALTGGDSGNSSVETLTARVVAVIEEGTRDPGDGTSAAYQRLLVRVESGSLQGQELTVEEGVLASTSEARFFRAGDRVYLERVAGPEGDHLYISDYVRTPALAWMLVLFIVLVVVVGWSQGIRSLAGTAFSVLVIFGFVVPRMIAGDDPIVVSLLGALVLLTVSTYLVFGWNMKAHAAVAGMTVSLVITAILASTFVGWTRLSGHGSEETSYLLMEMGPGVNLRGIILGGIIIGTLGVLDDICVGQSSSVFELYRANPNLTTWELMRRGLNIGRDHMSASVNTLVLAYVGASLPLFITFSLYQEPLLRRLSRESIAEEVVRTLVGSIGLILSVPITSLIASLLAPYEQRRHEDELDYLLQLISDGKPRTLVEVARTLRQSPDAVRALLQGLAAQGKVEAMRGPCEGVLECRGCRYRLACAVGDGDRIWVLVPEPLATAEVAPDAAGPAA